MALTSVEIANAELDVAALAAVVNGGATDPDVPTRTGPTIKTLARAIGEAAGAGGYEPPVAYAAGLNIIRTTQTVSYLDEIYAPVVGVVPFVTGGVFNPAQWRLVVSKTLVSRAEMKDAVVGDGVVLLLVDGDKTGVFRFSTANLKPSCDADPREGRFIKPTGGDGTAGAWVRQYDGAVNLRWFNSVGDGAANDNAALQAWLDAGGSLTIPRADYYSADDLILRRNATIDGDSYGFDARLVVGGDDDLGYRYMPGSRIRFAAGKGFKVQPQTTVTDVATAVAAGVGGYTQEGAFHSSISNLAFVGAGTGAAVAGFYSRTEVHLENVFCLKFMGKGFDISATADAPDGNSEFGAADLTTAKNCQAISCGGNGWHIRGREANVIHLDTCSSFGCGGWGFIDESLEGNLYSNCHAAGNTLGSYKCINADSTYDGCYVEDDGGRAPDLSVRCTVNGGQLANIVRQFNAGTNGHPTVSGAHGFQADQYALRGILDEATTVSNGHAIVFRGANRGLCLMGAPDGGGTYDVAIVNKNAALVAGVPTGTTTMHFYGALATDFAGFLFNGASAFPGLIATQAHARSDTVKGLVIAGYGSTYDSAMANRDGNVALGILTGTLNVEAAGHIRPAADNTLDLGSASKRFGTVYAGTGTINTSDERQKKAVKPIDDKLLDAWAAVEWSQFKFTDAVASKGTAGARVHTGLVAQRVRDTLKDAGVDGFAYGLLCHDHWDDEFEIETKAEKVYETRLVEREGEEPEEVRHYVGMQDVPVLDSKGKPKMRLVLAAGDRFGVRYEEALALEAAYQRRRADRMEKRLDALERKISS